MSRRKILIALGAFMTLVALVLGAFVFSRPRPQIDPATAAQLKGGMTEAEVDAVIGAPEGHYGPGFLLGRRDFDVFKTLAGAAKRKKWTGEHGIILVWFDNQGRMLLAEFIPAPW